MHLSLQNHATALPHQRELKCCGLCPSTTPTWLQTHALAHFSKSDLNFPLLWEKRERTAIHWQISVWGKHHGEGSWGSHQWYLLFWRKLQHRLHASALWKAHHKPPLPHAKKKTIWNENFPRKFCQSWAMPIDILVIRVKSCKLVYMLIH